MEDLTGDQPTLASELSGVAAVVAGRYRVRARLGRGATKEVYLAYDERLDREVALAIVVGAGSDAARARVAREAQVTGRLGDHPNVITVYDTGEHEGLPYLVLRAMPGGSLADLLHRARPSIADAIRLGREIAAALAHAHAHDVVHRDVKPDNVWLAADGSAALGDFGIAHQLGLERLTAEGVVVGTVRYLSPEQIRGEEIGPASDLYALGVTLYELVAGRAPFEARDATFVLTQHLTAAPEPPSRLEPAVPAGLEELILALLAKDPAQRPSSAADVAAALAAMATSTAAEGATRRSVGAGTERGRDARRLVAVLAARADVGDPEALAGVLDHCADIIEQHGGTVERYLGDQLMGFFGLTESHGDDPLRAARAAVALQATTSELRLGIDAGEVFISAGPRGAAVATGAAITAAGRLADGAAEGEILLGDSVRDAVEPDATVDPASGRLIELHPEQPGLLRAPATPFLGRAQELDQLQAAFARARDERACRLVTVAGPPGIGKSRLAGEFLTAIGGEATVLVGQCLAYGEGTTYRAIADIVRGLGGGDPRERIEQLMAGDEPAVRGILSAAGLSGEPVQAQETAWALRRLFERLAAERPLVVAVEDIQWAQPALLDLLDHVVTLSSGRPILLVCLTRPDLLDTHPAWAAPQPNRAVIVLDALRAAHAVELAQRLGAGDVARRIADRAEGNPLFVEQLVAVGEGEREAELPASIQAVLAARIDRLEPEERTLLQHAAVEGRTFHAGALAAVLDGDERAGIAIRLVALARKGLIGGDQPAFAGEDAFRFTHALIREAAYAGVPKLLRARIHADLGDWLGDREWTADEIIGYHLEQACLLSSELGLDGERERELAARAVVRLRVASRAALARGDPAAATAMLERAIALMRSDEAARLSLLPALGVTLFEGGHMAQAERVLDEAIEQATDAVVRARAEVEREIVRLTTETGAGGERALAVADAVAPVFEDADDAHGLCRTWLLRGQVAWDTGRVQDADDCWCEAAERAQHAGDERDLFDLLGWRAISAALGPISVDDAIARCEALHARVAVSPVAVAWVINPLALLHAMRGDVELADRLLGEAGAILDQLGSLGASASHVEAMVRLAGGRPELAERALRADLQTLTQMGDTSGLATTMALLAQALHAQDATQEAHELCRRTRATAAPDDILTQMVWRAVEARILARDGRCEEAQALARDAVALMVPTDLLSHHGDALVNLGVVLRQCHGNAQGDAEIRAALALYERKGNLAAAARARELLSA